MKEYAQTFYKGQAWQKLSSAYMESIHYICERCGGVAEICHHKKYITPDNINDPTITLNWDNLEGLCMDCHNKEHKIKDKDSMRLSFFDNKGQIQGVKESKEIREYKQALEKLDQLTEKLQEIPHSSS